MFVASEFSKSSSEKICWGNIWCLLQIWDKTFSSKCSVHLQMNRLSFCNQIMLYKVFIMLCDITKQLEIQSVYIGIA